MRSQFQCLADVVACPEEGTWCSECWLGDVFVLEEQSLSNVPCSCVGRTNSRGSNIAPTMAQCSIQLWCVLPTSVGSLA